MSEGCDSAEDLENNDAGVTGGDTPDLGAYINPSAADDEVMLGEEVVVGEKRMVVVC